MLIQRIGAGRTVIREENCDSSLENLHREMKHLEMRFRISRCNGYILTAIRFWGEEYT